MCLCAERYCCVDLRSLQSQELARIPSIASSASIKRSAGIYATAICQKHLEVTLPGSSFKRARRSQENYRQLLKLCGLSPIGANSQQWHEVKRIKPQSIERDEFLKANYGTCVSGNLCTEERERFSCQTKRARPETMRALPPFRVLDCPKHDPGPLLPTFLL